MSRTSVGPPLRLAVRLLSSHHPLCSYFDPDVVTVRRLRVCAGCLAVWPAASLSLVAAFSWPSLAPSVALVVGLLFGAPYVLAAFLRVPRDATHAIKVLGGLGLGLTAWGFMFVPGPLGWKLAALVAGSIGLTLLALMRMGRITSTCRRCPYAMDWETCPGMLGHASVTKAPRPNL